MADNKILSMSFAGGAALLCLILLFVPWWTGTVKQKTGFFGGGDTDTDEDSAGPFDDADGAASKGATVMAGLMTLLAFFAFGTAGAFFAVARFTRPSPDGRPNMLGVLAPYICAGGAFFLVLTVLLAPLTWPDFQWPDGSDAGFWDSNGDLDNDGYKGSTYASFGWYAAIVAAGVGVTAMIFGLRKQTATGYPVSAGWGAQPQPMGAFGQPMGGQPAAPGGWGAQPQQPPMQQYQQRAPPPPPPPPPPPAPPQQQHAPPGGAATSIPCPRCRNMVQAPPYRPVMLTCPTCGFAGRLEQ
jgi:hypothetical protein